MGRSYFSIHLFTLVCEHVQEYTVLCTWRPEDNFASLFSPSTIYDLRVQLMPSGLAAVPLPTELPCYPSWKCPKSQPAVLGFALGCQLHAVGSLTGNWIETPKTSSAVYVETDYGKHSMKSLVWASHLAMLYTLPEVAFCSRTCHGSPMAPSRLHSRPRFTSFSQERKQTP